VSRREIRLELPAALQAVAAKTLAEARLTRLWAERSRAAVTLPWRAMTIAPGDRVSVPGLAGVWRVVRTALEAMVVKLDLVLEAPATMPVVAADKGRNRAQVDLPHGTTTLQVIDLPPLSDVAETSAVLVVAANGVSGGWRRAALMTSADGGATWADAGGTALPTIIGTTTTVLGAGDPALVDRINNVEVQLIHAGLMLNDADETALLAGVNQAMVGDELIQFGRADPLGAGRWRLSELWRGRRGTEWAAVGQPAGSAFTLVEAVSLAPLPIRAVMAGVRVMATGVGDATGVVAVGPSDIGAATRPLSPAQLAARIAGADMAISWVRRSREGWLWRDGVDAPLSEESERYRLTKIAAGRPDLSVELATPAWTYSASERAADLAAGALNATISIVQVGSLGASRPASIIVPTL
jgi:hypothetical protein